MKKTLSIICVIVAVAMACTGCLSFSTHLLEETTIQAGNETTAFAETTLIADTTDIAGAESTTDGGIQETTSAVAQETTTVGSVQETTTVPSVQETTTVSSSQPTTNLSAPENTTAAGVVKSDYDILREGVFYCKGTMVDSTGTVPMEMAFSGSSVYITAAIDGINVGMLFNDKDVYMINVDKKTYMEVGDTLLKTLDMNREEMLESMDFGFESFGNLSDADEKTTVDVNGVACDCYVFRNDNGSMTHIYMNGNSLKGFASADSSGKVISANYIDYFTGDVPAYMINPSSALTKQNMVTFMAGLMSAMA